MAGETPCPRQHPQVNTASSNAHEREEKSGRLTETFASGWAHAARTLELMELMELMGIAPKQLAAGQAALQADSTRPGGAAHVLRAPDRPFCRA